MGVRCAWVLWKTFVIRTAVGQWTDPRYYMVKYSHTGLEQVKPRFQEALKIILVRSKHMEYKMFLRWLTKNSSSEYIVFHWLIPCPEKEYFLRWIYKKS